MDNYLIILLSLVLFYYVLMVYLKNKNSKQTFAENGPNPLGTNPVGTNPVGTNPVGTNPVGTNPVGPDKLETYHLDTRYDYPTTPPVNPEVYKSLLVNNIPVENGLYSNQEIIDNGYILDQNNNGNTNQLDYSGGSSQLIKIPLQMNEPYNEQLRSQEILITPYNKIKYSSSC